MESFDKRKYILKLLSSNKKGATIDTITDYLDYINRVQYMKSDIEIILQKMMTEKVVFCKNNIYYIETNSTKPPKLVE